MAPRKKRRKEGSRLHSPYMLILARCSELLCNNFGDCRRESELDDKGNIDNGLLIEDGCRKKIRSGNKWWR